MILVIDNYDSFTWNLVQLLEMAGEKDLRVVRNDEITVGEVEDMGPSAIVISPGPGRPEGAGRCIEIVRETSTVPTLGVCLGHQAIAVALGGSVRRSDVPRHGKISQVNHDGKGLFRDCRPGMSAVRYHSLEIDRETLPAELKVVAETPDGTIMAIEHVSRPLWGVQFHPESFGTDDGAKMIGNFLEERR
ncbi:MAG: aminodeoxychorismate/anthranilate synthase component II [Acidobacteria bacterium]|nr:aminodeoxychorismate/anthranilate synthase component II [Acidobacteriota bacterium]